ncbi:MAG: DCC1-like thiol-disulfide oxidoreductase family protein [bacterium]
MKPENQAPHRLNKPLVVYDGGCAFCSKWIGKSARVTSDSIDYLPSAQAARLFPQIPGNEFERAVQLIRPDGSRCSGAEAVFEVGAPHSLVARFLLRAYRRGGILRAVVDFAYRFIAANRKTLAFLTARF